MSHDMQNPDLCYSLSRRDFLRTAGIGIGSIPVFASPLLSGCKSSDHAMGKIGLQLYTVREEIQKDLAGTLKKVAAYGFEGVETASWPENVSIKDAGKFLKDAGLSVFAAHCELPTGENKDRMLEIAESYQCKKMIWHGWPEDVRYKTREGVKQLADIYNEANKFATSNGLEFGLHNHWWEIRDEIDGRYAFQVLMDDLDPGIFFEIDTYWAKVAGKNPADVVAYFGKRAPLLHIKDGPAEYNNAVAEDVSFMVPVGKGTQNFPEIVKAAAGNTEWMVVEMDRTQTNVFAAIEESYYYLVKNGLAKGRKPVS